MQDSAKNVELVEQACTSITYHFARHEFVRDFSFAQTKSNEKERDKKIK